MSANCYDDVDMNTLLRKSLEICLELNQDRDAGLQLQELLDAIAIELKRSGGGDKNVLKPLHKVLVTYLSDLERVLAPSRGLFRIRHHNSLLKVLVPVYESLLKPVISTERPNGHNNATSI